MLKSFKFDPKELRGLGIQIQKLEPANTAAQAPVGQSTLGFIRARADDSKKGNTLASTSTAAAMPLLSARPPVQDPVKSQQQQQPASNPFDLPSFSQVDQSVLQALPKEIREELENEYRKRREPAATTSAHEPKLFSKPFNLKPGPRVKFTGMFPEKKSKAPAELFPEKPAAAQGNWKRITHQLAPKGRANISPAKSALFALLERGQKKKKPPPMPRITDAKLVELGIDPEAFSCLPRQIQDEQLVMARLIKKNGRLPTPPERKVIKPNKLTLPDGYKVWRAPPPRARYHIMPTLKQKGKTKEENLSFSNADDVQVVIERWIDTYRHWAPRPKDIEYFSKFVLQSVDSSVAGDDGVMTAIKVMKWWMVLLRRVWPGSELEEEGEPDGSQTDRVGQAWWDTFRDVKRQMDAVARKKFGGSLSLR
jgi:DNA repair protein REV1